MSIDINKPAKYLEGKLLNDNWRVKERILKTPGKGSSFAETYIVERDGKTAILKALDFSIALLDEDPTKALMHLSRTYDFEKELLELCQSKKLSRIVNILEQGTIPPISGSIIPVPYFILEYAVNDVKSQIDFDSRFNTVWLLKILHNVTVGLWQLHKQGVAHKDLRPENIQEFNKSIQKLAELGRSEKRDKENPNSDLTDDPSYMPPEYLYGHNEKEWIYRNQASDVYQLGNLVFFLFTQSTFNTWLFFALDEISPNYRPGKWGGTFEDVLPYLIEAYDYAINYFLPWIEDDAIKVEMEGILRQLCHPDPKRRGHPKNISGGDILSVERFITKFDRLGKLSEINLAKKKNGAAKY